MVSDPDVTTQKVRRIPRPRRFERCACSWRGLLQQPDFALTPRTLRLVTRLLNASRWPSTRPGQMGPDGGSDRGSYDSWASHSRGTERGLLISGRSGGACVGLWLLTEPMRAVRAALGFAGAGRWGAQFGRRCGRCHPGRSGTCAPGWKQVSCAGRTQTAGSAARYRWLADPEVRPRAARRKPRVARGASSARGLLHVAGEAGPYGAEGLPSGRVDATPRSGERQP